MKFSEIKHHVEEYLNNPVGMNETEVKILKDSFDCLVSDIQKLVIGDKLEHNTDTFDKILKCLLLVGNKILYGPMSDNFCAMSISFSEAVYNWNGNTFRDEVIKQQCLFISRSVEIRNTLLKTSEIIKEYEDRMKLLANWAPPAYEIAHEYLTRLLEKNERKE